MTSKYQKREFPLNKLGKMKKLIVSINGEALEINYQELKLVYMYGQICFYYQSDDGYLVMPIARKSTIDNLVETEI